MLKMALKSFVIHIIRVRHTSHLHLIYIVVFPIGDGTPAGLSLDITVIFLECPIAQGICVTMFPSIIDNNVYTYSFEICLMLTNI
jgi:hypothetical protein